MKPSAMPAVGDALCAVLPLSLCDDCEAVVFVCPFCVPFVFWLCALFVAVPFSLLGLKPENRWENCDNSSKNFKACSEFFSSPSRGFTERSKSGFCDR